MALVFGDRVKETTTTTGTGTLTLAGAPAGYKAFATAMSINDTCYYSITSDTTTDWEIGVGTLTESNKLVRSVILKSSNSDAVLTLDAGTKNVFLTFPKAFIDTLVTLTATQTLSNKTFTTPVLGVATATSINKLAITAPATAATLTIADGKTFTASNTLTLSGADGSTLNIGAGGTLGTMAYETATSYAPASHTHSYASLAGSSSQSFATAALTATGIVKSQNAGGTIYTKIDTDGVYSVGTDLCLLAPAGKNTLIYADDALVGTFSSTGLAVVGNLALGSAVISSAIVCNVTHDSGVSDGFIVNDTRAGSDNGPNFVFRRRGTDTGSIYWNETTTTYATSSDYRLKNITGDVQNSGEFIDALKPRVGTWKANDQPFCGFLAHEFKEVSPSSVSGDKDAINADGKPIYQAMQAGSSEVIANIVAELQLLRKRVLVLEV